ncbi:MAG: ExbD/TolR family protein [Alphaproteobacteria bacterium]
MSEINVTPFVDVMMVLLVIFMVTAPLLTVGVPVDLPETQAGPLTGSDEPLSVSITADARVYVQDTEIPIDALVPKLMQITRNNPDVRIFLRADETVDYGRFMTVLGTLNAAGFNRVGLVGEAPAP